MNLGGNILVLYQQEDLPSLCIYKQVLPKIVKNFRCIFTRGIPKALDYIAVIYIGEKMNISLLRGIKLSIYALGLREITENLHLFKQVFLPDQKDLVKACQIIGASRVHYFPDIRYLWGKSLFKYDPKGSLVFLSKPSLRTTQRKRISFAVCNDSLSEVLCVLSECPYIFSNNRKEIKQAYKDRFLIQSKLSEKLAGIYGLLNSNQINNLLIHELKPLGLNLRLLDPELKVPPVKTASYLSFRLTGRIDNKCVKNILKQWSDLPQILKEESLEEIGPKINKQESSFPRKLNLTFIDQSIAPGIHRSGWQYVLDSFYFLHSEKGLICDTYLDKTFGQGLYPMKQSGIIPYTSPWIGFLHHTPLTGYSQNTCWNMLGTREFQQSCKTCYGIICLSEYLSSWLRERLSEFKIPILTLYHPTLFVEKVWSWEEFQKKRRIVNIGAWYRNPFTIYQLKVPPEWTKCTLRGKRMKGYFPPEDFILTREQILLPEMGMGKWLYYLCKYLQNLIKENPEKATVSRNELEMIIRSVEIINCLDNDSYDDLLMTSLVFLDLVDASAVNTIIECIVRETPVLVNRLPALEEYLGEDYPLFYTNLSEAEKLLQSDEIIKQAHQYLHVKDKTFLRIEYFLEKLVNSELYQKLPLF